MADFYSMVYWMDSVGILDVLLPFLLIFSLSFAILSNIKLFNRKTNSIIALVIGFSVVVQHILYPSPSDVVSFINRFIPNVAALIVVGLLLLMVIGLFNKDAMKTNLVKVVTPIVAVLIFIIILLQNLHLYELPSFLYWLADPETQSLIIILIVFILLVNWITGDSKEGKGKNGGKNTKNNLSEVLKWLGSGDGEGGEENK